MGRTQSTRGTSTRWSDRWWPRPAVVLLAAALAVTPVRAGGAPEVTSVADLWRGFDPEALPLEVETVRSWEENGIALQTLRFTGVRAGEGRVRVFAIRGAPLEGKKLPGVLHVHGGGQTASPDWVRFWAKRGYVCVSFDFCGPWEKRTEFTDWGPVKNGNMRDAGAGFQMEPTPRASSWYHWAAASRRALTLLARHPQADPDRLGVFGVSVGGSLTWMIAGSDPRVKAAVPVYGCGYNYDRRNARWDILAPNETYNRFQRLLSPEAHAPYVSCPVLFLSATNDGHGLMDRAYDALAATSGVTYQAFSPRADHHIEPREGRNLGLWMDWHLKSGTPWPKGPGLRLALDRAGVPEAVVSPEAPADAAGVDVYYCLGDKRPQVRFWRRSEARREGMEWRAALPVLDAWDDLRAFANVTYRGGVCLSTPLRHAVPGQLGKPRATLAWQPDLGHGADGLDHWKFLGAYTDPVVDWTHLTTGRDEEVGPFVAFNLERLGDPVPVRLYTHLIGDPQFQGRPGLALALHVRGEFTGEGLTLTVHRQDRSLHARAFSATVPAKDLGPGWRQLVLPPGRFTDKDGQPLDGWHDLDRLDIVGRAARREPPRFARLRWLDPGKDDPKKASP